MAVRRELDPQMLDMTQQDFARLLDKIGRMKAQRRYETFAGLTGNLPDPEKVREEMLSIMKQIVDFDDSIMSGAVDMRKAELEHQLKVLQVIEGISKSELSGQASIQSSQISARGSTSKSFLQAAGVEDRLKAMELSKVAKNDTLSLIRSLELETQNAAPETVLGAQAGIAARLREVLDKSPTEMGKIMRFINDNTKNPAVQRALVNSISGTTTAAEAQRQAQAMDQEFEQVSGVLQDAQKRLNEQISKGGVSGSATLRATFRQMDKLMPGVLQPDGSIDINVRKMRESLPRDENGKVPSIVALETQLAALQNDPTYEDLRRELLDDPSTAAFAKSVGLEGAPADMIIKKARQLHRKAYRKMRREARRGGESGSFWDEYTFLGPPERDEEPVVDPTEGATKAAQATEGSGAQEASSAAAAGARRKAAAVKQQAQMEAGQDVSSVKTKAEAQKQVDEAVRQAGPSSHEYGPGDTEFSRRQSGAAVQPGVLSQAGSLIGGLLTDFSNPENVRRAVELEKSIANSMPSNPFVRENLGLGARETAASTRDYLRKVKMAQDMAKKPTAPSTIARTPPPAKERAQTVSGESGRELTDQEFLEQNHAELLRQRNLLKK
jgi:hypothetical protein